MLTGALLPGLAGTVFLPASASSVRRRLMLRSAIRLVGIERQRGLVVLAGRGQLALLPERLGQAVLGLAVGAHLQQPLVDPGRLFPLRGGRRVDGLLDQLALQTGGGEGVRRARCLRSGC